MKILLNYLGQAMVNTSWRANLFLENELGQ